MRGWIGRRRREAELLAAVDRVEQMFELQVLDALTRIEALLPGGGAGGREDPGPVADVASVGPVLDTPSRPDRILWNRRPKNARDTGDIDEIVAHNVTVHIEQMDDRCWWIGITWPDGSSWDGNFHATKKGKMTFGQQAPLDGGWPSDEEHEQ